MKTGINASSSYFLFLYRISLFIPSFLLIDTTLPAVLLIILTSVTGILGLLLRFQVFLVPTGWVERDAIIYRRPVDDRPNLKTDLIGDFAANALLVPNIAAGRQEMLLPMRPRRK